MNKFTNLISTNLPLSEDLSTKVIEDQSTSSASTGQTFDLVLTMAQQQFPITFIYYSPKSLQQKSDFFPIFFIDLLRSMWKKYCPMK